MTIRGWLAVLAGSVGCGLAYAAHLYWQRPGTLVLWLLYGVLVVAVMRLPADGIRAAVPLVVLGAALVQLPGLTLAPQSSSDAYRYVWDGRVQLAGHSPYTRAPLDDDLADLRDPVLFPGLGPQDRTDVHGLSSNPADDDRTRINRPLVPTIYPPLAQAWFAVVAAVTPWPAGTLGIQLGAALAAIGTTALLAVAFVRRRGPPWPALVFGWSPMVALEAGNNGHIEVLMTLLVVGAVVTVRRRILSGVLLGLAIAAKLVPIVLLPALRAIGVRGRLATAGTLATGYLPHLLVAGLLAFGYLPGYLGEEGFDSGNSRYAVLALVVPEGLRAPVAVLLGLVLAVMAWRRGESDPAGTATWLFGAALLIATPTYPWYTLPLLGLAVLTHRWEWLAVVVASYAAYAAYTNPVQVSLYYAAATVVVLAPVVGRLRVAVRGTDCCEQPRDSLRCRRHLGRHHVHTHRVLVAGDPQVRARRTDGGDPPGGRDGVGRPARARAR